ncbi:hypothetical protein BDW59DRAFT_78665 [Aspergillus cavernicola]|uniref:Uncharacterized protein n=1 Tax=Aspergillus cavernicola TaxID=176166 RepID=A0ABR4J066_9EURO
MLTKNKIGYLHSRALPSNLLRWTATIHFRRKYPWLYFVYLQRHPKSGYYGAPSATALQIPTIRAKYPCVNRPGSQSIMCHHISWYHALCLHTDHTSTVRIGCKTALHCNYGCGILESWSLPMLGACCRKASIMESFEDEVLVENDEAYFSGTHSEDSIDDMELFDKITF